MTDRFRRGLRIIANAIAAITEAPAEVRSIWEEAARRDNAEEERMDRESPGWRRGTFDGPGSHVALIHHIEQICAERGTTDTMKQWIRDVFETSEA